MRGKRYPSLFRRHKIRQEVEKKTADGKTVTDSNGKPVMKQKKSKSRRKSSPF